jgi:hypothetical protein
MQDKVTGGVLLSPLEVSGFERRGDLTSDDLFSLSMLAMSVTSPKTASVII